jgi:hypothetical protein
VILTLDQLHDSPADGKEVGYSIQVGISTQGRMICRQKYRLHLSCALSDAPRGRRIDNPMVFAAAFWKGSGRTIWLDALELQMHANLNWD